MNLCILWWPSLIWNLQLHFRFRTRSSMVSNDIVSSASRWSETCETYIKAFWTCCVFVRNVNLGKPAKAASQPALGGRRPTQAQPAPEASKSPSKWLKGKRVTLGNKYMYLDEKRNLIHIMSWKSRSQCFKGYFYEDDVWSPIFAKRIV